MSTETKVPLTDGQVRSLTKDMVLSAARSQAEVEDDDTRVLVEVDGRTYDALALVALALTEPPDRIRPLAALHALAKLELHPSGFDSPSEDTKAPPTSYEEEEPQTAGDELRLDQVSPALNRMLQRKRGRWVALQRDEIVADDPSLPQLLQQVEGREVTVLFVPAKDA